MHPLVAFRHSRARRMIESTFGLLCSRWRILLKPIEVKVDKAELIVQAVVCLHNFLVEELGETFIAAFTPDDAPEQCTLPQAQLQHPRANRARREAEDVRAKIIDFVNGIGAVEWQEARALVPPTQATDADDDDGSQAGERADETQEDDAGSNYSDEL